VFAARLTGMGQPCRMAEALSGMAGEGSGSIVPSAAGSDLKRLKNVLEALECSGSDRRIYEIIYIRLVFFCIFKCDQIDRKWREEKEKERERERRDMKRKDAAGRNRKTMRVN
jgi:hypothetical protein